MRQVFEVYSHGVCLIHGMYTLMVRDAERLVPVMDTDGEPAVLEYFGSGFLGAEGIVVTNRHVAEPWWHNSEIQPLIEQGLIPQFVYLSVTFPGHDPVEVDPSTIRVSPDDVDIAVLKVDVSGVPVLPLFEGDVRASRGDRVVLLGYPTGPPAMLARAESALAHEMYMAANGDNKRLVLELARRGAISPIITQGSLNEVLERRLVYDAGTTGGGSGGPVFGPDGTVIGVNFAMTRDFHASNFGVPIQFARVLLQPDPIAHLQP
jgi:S1-C subfamily serine protease